MTCFISLCTTAHFTATNKRYILALNRKTTLLSNFCNVFFFVLSFLFVFFFSFVFFSMDSGRAMLQLHRRELFPYNPVLLNSEIHGNEIKGKPAHTNLYIEERVIFFFLFASPCFRWFFLCFCFCVRSRFLAPYLRYIFAYKSINVDCFFFVAVVAAAVLCVA